MKRPFLLTLIASFFAICSFAQNKPLKALETAKIKTPNVLCEECKKRLTTYLDRYDGIQSTVVNYRKGEMTVKYWTDRINIEEIKTAIANAGYDADDIPAEEGAYKRLPKTCKKAEDGGDHPKPKETPATPAAE
ncbi:MAG: copper chaperone [Chitinophagaceae bacterium]|nr:MAG: copper chaperone [Chitinophagaceae bacterium]